MWSLGCVVAELFLGWPLYPGSSEYDQIRYICQTQNLPNLDMLTNASKTSKFFYRDVTYQNNWRLKVILTCLILYNVLNIINYFLDNGRTRSRNWN